MIPRLAPLVLLLALAACAKDGSRNSVWLAVKNETGGGLSDFTLDYGTGRLQYKVFTAGYTFGLWARVRGRQPLSIAYTDASGERRAPDPGPALEPDQVGGRLILALRPDGSVERSYEKWQGPPPTVSNRLQDHAPWLLGVLALFLVPPLVAAVRKVKPALGEARRRVKAFFSNPARDGAVARLGLVWKECPVRMFTMDPKDPISWHEGTIDGRMLGLLDHGRLWVGAPDTATIVAFERGADGVFSGRDFTERQDNPLLSDEEMRRGLSGLSPAVNAVGVLGAAVEATFDWKRATAEGIVSDAKALSVLRARVETYDPPLVRAVLAGDERKARALIAAGASLEAETIGHVTPVIAAVQGGRADLLRPLLAAGAKPGEYPLYEAAGRGDLESVEALVEAGASCRATAWGTPLHPAAANGRAEVVAYLLAKGCDPNVKNSDGATALGFARYGKHARVIELLKSAGAA